MMNTKEAHLGWRIRLARPDDLAAAYRVCLETGDAGNDATAMYADDPDALGRMYVGGYFAFEPRLAFVLEDEAGVCGYALGSLDSRRYYQKYLEEWLPALQREFPAPRGDRAGWTAAEKIHEEYHHPVIHMPEPYGHYPSHLHIDLMRRAQGRGMGARMMDLLIGEIRRLGSAGIHLAMHPENHRAHRFYSKLGFQELIRTGSGDTDTLYLGLRLKA